MGIKVFTTNNCAYCVMLKRWLSSKHVEFEEVNIEDDQNKRQEIIDLSGSMTVPVTLITKDNGDQKVIVGYNLAQLAPSIN